MKRMIATLSLIVFFLPLSAAENGLEQIVRDYVDAYNRHDIDAMLELLNDRFRWMSVVENNVIVEAEGKAALVKSMQGYFSSIPSVRSSLMSLEVRGDFVSVIEKAMWEAKGESRSQCARAVYEVVDRQILNVWYYEALPCDSAELQGTATIRQN